MKDTGGQVLCAFQDSASPDYIQPEMEYEEIRGTKIVKRINLYEEIFK
jgi:hypothetical protein